MIKVIAIILILIVLLVFGCLMTSRFSSFMSKNGSFSRFDRRGSGKAIPLSKLTSEKKSSALKK